MHLSIDCLFVRTDDRVAEDGDSYMEVKNGTMTYYIGKKGNAEAADSFIIVLAGGDEPHGLILCYA
ncbi:MAG: hypothetical protein K6G24_08770 [Lachnospiraceae bacterium]|nr:hypothetical protein [Lachnospiraceae bacterium]